MSENIEELSMRILRWIVQLAQLPRTALSYDATGGVYEHKVANKLDCDYNAAYLAACELLESQGLVRRQKRGADYEMLGIWPTREGWRKAGLLARHNWLAIENGFVWTCVDPSTHGAAQSDCLGCGRAVTVPYNNPTFAQIDELDRG